MTRVPQHTHCLSICLQKSNTHAVHTNTHALELVLQCQFQTNFDQTGTHLCAHTHPHSMVKQSLRQTMNSQLCSSFKPLCVFELQMWMLTEGSVHKLQDCRDGSSPIGSGTAQAFCVVHHLHCSFSHSKETGGALSLCFVAGDHLKVHPQARACAFYSIWQPQRLFTDMLL